VSFVCPMNVRLGEVRASARSPYINNNVPTKIKNTYKQPHTVAMSSNEDLQVDNDRGHGLRVTNKNIEGHVARGNTGGYHGANKNEIEQVHQEQEKIQDHPSKYSTEEHDPWNEVGAY
jgi:hypothetical protein